MAQGNKSFSPFSNLSDEEALRRTWKVCTKVAAHLENGQRLENLSWRLWHLGKLMQKGETNSNKMKREFKKLSRTTGEKLDKDRNKPLHELTAPTLPSIRSTTSSHLNTYSSTTSNFPFPNPSVQLLQRYEVASEEERVKLLEKQRAIEAVRAKDREREERRRIEKLRMAALFESAGDAESAWVHNPQNGTTNTTKSKVQDLLVEAAMSSGGVLAKKLGSPSEKVGHTFGSSYGSYAPATGPFPEFRTPSPSIISGGSPELGQFPSDNIFDHPDLTEPDREFLPQSLFFANFDSMFSDFHPSAILAPWDPFEFGSSRPVVELPLDRFLQDIDREMAGTQLPAIVEGTESELTDGHGHQQQPQQGVNQSTQTGEGNGFQVQQQQQHLWDPNFHPPLAFPLANFDYPHLGVNSSPDRFKHRHAELPPVEPIIPIEDIRKSPSPADSGASSPVSQRSRASSQSSRLAVWHPPLIPPVFPETLDLSVTGSHEKAWTFPQHQDHHRDQLSVHGFGEGTDGDKDLVHEATQPPPPPPPPLPEMRKVQKKHKNPSATQPPLNIASESPRPQCSNCGAHQTPLWRRGNNEELLCNACGLYLKLHKTHRPKSFGQKAPSAAPPKQFQLHPSASRTGSSSSSSHPTGAVTSAPPPRKFANSDQPVHCRNCKADQTPMWRKVEGQLLCNACALYAKMHKSPRPIGNNGRKRKSSVSNAQASDRPSASVNRRHSESDAKGPPHLPPQLASQIPVWASAGTPGVQKRTSMTSKDAAAPLPPRVYAVLPPRAYAQPSAAMSTTTAESSQSQPQLQASHHWQSANSTITTGVEEEREAKKPRLDNYASASAIVDSEMNPSSYTFYHQHHQQQSQSQPNYPVSVSQSPYTVAGVTNAASTGNNGGYAAFPFEGPNTNTNTTNASTNNHSSHINDSA